MPKIFENMYPITDQIDVLISNCKDKLNIYNIEDTVYQKNLKTNTQNNLHAIFHSPNYKVLRKEAFKIEKLCNYFANKIPQIQRSCRNRNNKCQCSNYC